VPAKALRIDVFQAIGRGSSTELQPHWSWCWFVISIQKSAGNQASASGSVASAAEGLTKCPAEGLSFSHTQGGFMHRNLPKQPDDASDGLPPSEAWLFAQAISGKPIPRIVSPEAKARAKREELERLAQLSSRHAEELRGLQAAEAEARHDREILEWAA
jgi:hypothetical protein